MTAARGHTGFVEFRMEEQRAESALPARRVTINTNSADVVIRILRGYRLVPKDSVRKTGISKVLPANVMKSLRPIGSTHTVYLDHDKTELSLGLHRIIGTERFGDEGILWSGV